MNSGIKTVERAFISPIRDRYRGRTAEIKAYRSLESILVCRAPPGSMTVGGRNRANKSPLAANRRGAADGRRPVFGAQRLSDLAGIA